MSKSVPSGTQNVVNPVAQMQMPYMQALWNAGQSVAGLTGQGPASGTAEYLDPIRQYTQQQFANTQTPSSWVMPNAANFTAHALSGQWPQANLPAGPQIGQLTGMGNAAAQAGLNYAAPLAASGVAAQNVGAGYGNALANLWPGAVGTGQQYGGALGDIAQGAVNTGQQYGSGIANAAYGAPGTVAPWTRGMGSLAGAAQNIANPAAAGLYGNAGMAVSGNPIYNSLMGMAGGQYVDPRSNPALAGTLQAATDPLVRQYMTATAPQTASGFEGAGRYGSGAMANAQSQNQQNLGKAIGDTTSGIVNNAYNTGLNSMLGAGSALGQAYNTGTANISDALARAGALGQSGVNNAANIMQQGGALDLGALSSMMSGLGTAGQVAGQGYQTGTGAYNAAANAANQGYATGGNILGTAGQVTNQGYGTGGQMLANAGQLANQGYGTGITGMSQAGNLANTGTLNLGGIAQMSPELANFPLSQLSAGYNTMWSPLQNYAGLLGVAPQGGSSNTSGTQQQNVASNILGTLGGIASLAKAI